MISIFTEYNLAFYEIDLHLCTNSDKPPPFHTDLKLPLTVDGTLTGHGHLLCYKIRYMYIKIKLTVNICTVLGGFKLLHMININYKIFIEGSITDLVDFNFKNLNKQNCCFLQIIIINRIHL